MHSENPLQHPEPYQETGNTLGYWMIYCLVAGGAFLALTGMRPVACRGGTRSTKLKWEERQAEIKKAVQPNGEPRYEHR